MISVFDLHQNQNKNMLLNKPARYKVSRSPVDWHDWSMEHDLIQSKRHFRSGLDWNRIELKEDWRNLGGIMTCLNTSMNIFLKYMIGIIMLWFLRTVNTFRRWILWGQFHRLKVSVLKLLYMDLIPAKWIWNVLSLREA